MKLTEKITITNEDNMELMARYPDKYFDLAIVDPPYGIMDKIISGGESNRKIKIQKGLVKFNDVVPDKEYFQELFRVSKNQIIWGGNYFPNYLNHSRGWIVWDKKISEGMSFAMCELAYTSFNTNAKIFRSVVGDKHFHPTQKPVALYKWVLDKYAKIKCDHKHSEAERYLCTDCNNGKVKILDTHLGSGSIAIACHDYGFELTACELDAEYYDKAINRITNHVAQQKLF